MDYSVTPATRELDAALRRKIDQKTKPLGALGHLEALALQMGRVRGTLTPTLAMPHIVVLAGDHGAAKAGISAYPQEVTWQMVENFLAGGAAINVFARANDIGLTIVDAGVAHDFGARENLVDAKVSRGGTLSYLDGAAMSAEQRDIAMTKGAEIARKLAAEGCTVVGFGEMGIGNTASASLITHCLTELPLAACIGRGTGLDDAGLARKQALLEQALAAWPERSADPLAVLARYGGFEIAMMTGAMLAAAQQKMLVLVDGFICGAAALTAARICPDFLDYAVFCHASAEAGHRAQLGALNVSPLITLDLRLGEGTGAALAWPLVRAACAFLNEMASFESAGVSEKL
ncbi:MAG: nicotinate-nucleotide--dimethylbenzimidazole phosphoribosyltransferase [Rhodocyclaceae bacterium]|jgi:nicotinate-nucleotide--dimethylbenzimidazole phosphoribosyltransferase|nr:nicotinate-nucleotide--dimethylbenzimidazole phosphoribosyltransferase [Rhodocyclaceae bacterium]MBK6677528.1 nicotinate-nucleotide--dimethylbenzimidazole phosphoribosyltransferase [Rhodocyclaceae bacterium]MBK9310186.1 nicotinate-nucleotide--dimethylbenzimidazole phosphoribosyltransferase [Rhodocyclaceae bacterium]MBK9954741.1 nicotinate-nucleotide--dimethylbenzimidazole phosphoribosyltransferase [Rhodocyclaceae bacterium]